MERARLRWRRINTAALLGFLSLTLLIPPGDSALQCHSFTSFQSVSRGRIGGLSLESSDSSNCTTSQNHCVEARLMFSTAKEGILVTHRGCASEGPKEEAGPATFSNPHLTVHSVVRYCHSLFCNQDLVGPDIFSVPKQANASEANGSNQCYSDITLYTSDIYPNEDIPDRVTCGGDYSQCYLGKATITAGNLGMDFHVKTCQDPSCNVPEVQSFGPIRMELWGSCCHGAFCNRQMTAPQIQGNGSTWNTTRREDFSDPDLGNDTENSFTVPEEVTVTPDQEWDIDAGTTTTHNPLYDDEEIEEDGFQLPVSTNKTLNPRANNLGPPNPSLPFYLLLGALGLAILGVW